MCIAAWAKLQNTKIIHLFMQMEELRSDKKAAFTSFDVLLHFIECMI